MEKKPFHAAYIDGLRAIAVLSVIVYHLNPVWLPGGFAGVDVFFVISGFVVAISVSELRDISLGRFLAYFYARRLVRITPALVVMLLATFLASALFIPEAWLSSTNQRTGLWAFLGLSNFVLAADTGNYFSPIAEFNPFTHTWSLAVEEQFYLSFPWLFYMWLRGRNSLSRWTILVALVASLVCAIWLRRTNETYAFYMIWSRYWELAVGVLLFQFMVARGHSFGDRSPDRRRFALAAGVGLITLAIGLIVAPPQAAPFPACLLPVIGTAIVLGTLHGRAAGRVNWLLTLRPMVYIGKISYSLYLWHWPVYVLFRWTVGLENPLERVAAIAITAILSAACYHFVEQPPRRAARGAKTAAMIAAGLMLIASGYAVSSAVASNQSQISLSTVTRNMALWYPFGPADLHDASGCWPMQTSRDFAGGTEVVYTRGGCNLPVTYTHSIFVLGDSHAMAYVGMLRQMVLQTGATVHAYNMGGCPFISLQPRIPGRDEQCRAFGAASVKDMLPQIKPGDIVLLASLRLPRMVDQWAAFGVQGALDTVNSEAGQQGRRDGVEQALPILKAMTARGAHVVFEAPTPMLPSIPFRCADWFNRSNPICALGLSMPRSQLKELRAPILASYAQMAHSVPGVSVWDPLPVICPGSECQAFRDGKPLLFDGDHISFYTNTLLLPSFMAYVETLGAQDVTPASANEAKAS